MGIDMQEHLLPLSRRRQKGAFRDEDLIADSMDFNNKAGCVFELHYATKRSDHYSLVSKAKPSKPSPWLTCLVNA
jgi:hypothetical protein